MKKAPISEVEEAAKPMKILLMEEILHQLIWRNYHYLRGFMHLRWLFGISEPSTVVGGETTPLKHS